MRLHGESTEDQFVIEDANVYGQTIVAETVVEPTTTPTINSLVVAASLNIEATGLSVLMAKINGGVYDEVIYGLTPDEIKATFDAMMALWDKFLIVDPNADTSPASNAEVNDVSTINHHVHGLSYLIAATTKSILDPQASAVNEAIVRIPKPVLYAGAAGGVTSIPIKDKANFRYVKSNNVCEGVDLSILIKFDSNKGLEYVLENGPWMIRNSSIILKKWTINTSLFKEELNRIPVWVKIHDVPLQVFDCKLNWLANYALFFY
ncbi:zinc knuckle CX2CX4HX4C containing protein [Tanacetum coccineum]